MSDEVAYFAAIVIVLIGFSSWILLIAIEEAEKKIFDAVAQSAKAGEG